ncbi:MAG: hypothetical protein AB1540_18130 [Bdellovibrionota bacterium]
MGLVLQVQTVSAQGPPCRSIELDCILENKFGGPSEVAILEAWVTVVTARNLTVADGFCLRQHHVRTERATFRTGIRYLCKISLPLNAELIEAIEKERHGQDIEFLIRSRVLVAPIQSMSMEARQSTFILAPPEEIEFVDSRGSSPIRHPIAESEWIKILTQLKWSEIELFEVPMEAFSADTELQRAIGLVRTAQERFQQGDWDGTLESCYRAFEAASVDAGQTQEKKENFKKLLDRVGGGEKSERLNTLIKSLNNYCHLGRHEDFPAVTITCADARAVLRCTLSIFSLLGGRP